MNLQKHKRKHFSRLKRSHIYQRDGGICGLCKKKIVDFNDSTIDHKIPLWGGGGNGKTNLQIAHSWCNQAKNVEDQKTQKLLKALKKSANTIKKIK